MNVYLNENNGLPKGSKENILSALSKPLQRFGDKIKSVSVQVKNVRHDKPSVLKTLQVLIVLKSGKEYFLVKNNISLLVASSKMVKALKNLMSRIINEKPLRKRQNLKLSHINLN